MLFRSFLFSVLFILGSCTPKPTASNIIYEKADVMPRFPGCKDDMESDDLKNCTIKRLYGFIRKHRKYPQQAASDGVEGNVVVRFIVQKNGSLKDFKLVNKIGQGCDEESLRIARLMPNWIPGKLDGKTVDVYSEIKVDFFLE